MKAVLSAVLCFALASFVQAGLDKEKAITLFNTCKEQVNATEDVAQLIDGKIVPETHEGKCMLLCVVEKTGLLTEDGKINKEALTKFLQEKHSDEPEKLKKIESGIETCSTIDVTGLDNCEAIAKHMQCGKEQMGKQ